MTKQRWKFPEITNLCLRNKILDVRPAATKIPFPITEEKNQRPREGTERFREKTLQTESRSRMTSLQGTTIFGGGNRAG